MSEHITAVTSENFEAEVLQSHLPVLIDFWATWCGPCRMLSPVVDEVAEELAGKVKVCKVNTDEAPELCAAFGIESIPTLVVMRDGKFVRKSVGCIPKASILKLLAD